MCYVVALRYCYQYHNTALSLDIFQVSSKFVEIVLKRIILEEIYLWQCVDAASAIGSCGRVVRLERIAKDVPMPPMLLQNVSCLFADLYSIVSLNSKLPCTKIFLTRLRN